MATPIHTRIAQDLADHLPEDLVEVQALRDATGKDLRLILVYLVLFPILFPLGTIAAFAIRGRQETNWMRNIRTQQGLTLPSVKAAA